MTVFGNRPPPYHDRGYEQCLDEIRLAAEKALIILHETDGDLAALSIKELETIREYGVRLREVSFRGRS